MSRLMRRSNSTSAARSSRNAARPSSRKPRKRSPRSRLMAMAPPPEHSLSKACDPMEHGDRAGAPVSLGESGQAARVQEHLDRVLDAFGDGAVAQTMRDA